ncbi:hypothetical protein E2C06_05320 [Dankookia rubra]|uniref:Uncharacterized protein n=1 Tax=Dankookia rubra TaxID=1442381 RepID=A0A4R5QLY4_9PROT|nr:hypothetical protein [Dankookia rubra]TDH63747.1 hypothetical protein E2C06_05320 [Dankookia rubra]
MPDDPAAAAPFGPPPQLVLRQMSGPAGLRAEGDNWVLDLGQVEAGSLLRTFGVAVMNDAAPPADALTVRFAVEGDPDMRFFVPAAFSDIGPQTGRGEVDVVLSATTPGLHEARLVLHPEQVAADGSVTALPDRVVLIREEVVGTLAAATIAADAFTTGRPDDLVLTAPVRLEGVDFARIQNLGSWTGSGTLDFTPHRADGDAWLLATFQTVHADFTGTGQGKTVDVVGAGGGSLVLAHGDTALWSFAGDNAGGTAAITTHGQATLRLTAIGADTLDDRIAANSLLPYAIYPFSVPRGNSTYDGHLSTAQVELGGRGNTVTAEAMVNLTVTGGAGHNHVAGGGGVNLFALTGTHDWLESGSGQTTFVEQAGSLRGDRITGFHAGDLIRFEGFGPDARLRDLGEGHYRVVDGAGHREAFTVEGVDHLVAGVDYLFA